MPATLKRPSVELDIELDKGANFIHTFKYETGDRNSTTPVDLTDCTAKIQIRTSSRRANTLYEATTENGNLTLGGILGTIDINIPAATTKAFKWNQANYELEITFPDTTVKKILRGVITAFDEVS